MAPASASDFSLARSQYRCKDLPYAMGVMALLTNALLNFPVLVVLAFIGYTYYAFVFVYLELLPFVALRGILVPPGERILFYRDSE